jgi:hypothetical protein
VIEKEKAFRYSKNCLPTSKFYPAPLPRSHRPRAVE